MNIDDIADDYDHNIHTNPDHEAWADFFIQTWPNGCADRDTMAGWFANAMMAKADSMINEKPEQPEILEGVQENGKKWPECVCPDRPNKEPPAGRV